MEFIVNNWYLIMAAIAALVCAIGALLKFLVLPNSTKIEQVKEWLLWAVTQAEIKLGSGTGELKLRFVYDMFVTKFPYLAPFISFQKFSEMVQEALDKLEELLSSNEKVKKLVEEEE